MAVETVFLIVLVAALSIGNLLLSFIPYYNSNKKNGLENNFTVQNELEAQSELSGKSDSSNDSSQAEVFYSNFGALNQKLNILTKQFELLDSKVRKVDNFRANSEIEMKALKEIIVKLQNKYLAASSKKISKPADLSSSEMHKIIYKSD